MESDIIKISHLNKSFGEVKAVNDLSFRVKKGELFAFLGVNGAGKSTTISILCGLLKKDSGTVQVNGIETDKASAQTKRMLGVVFQDSVLDKPLTVKENLMSRAALYGITGNAFDKRLQELVEILDFDEFLNRPVGKLSGGQRRRIDIARALLHRPEILIVLYATFLAKVFRDSFIAAIPDMITISDKLINGTVAAQLTASLMAVSCITVTFCVNLTMVQDKANGTRKDFNVSPVSKGKIYLGYFLSTVANSLMVNGLAFVLCLGYLLKMGWYMNAADVLWVLFDMILLVLFGSTLSSIISFPLTTQGQLSAVGTIVSAGYGFICGAYMPISNFGSGLQKALSYLPSTYATSLIKNHMLHGVFREMERKHYPDEMVEAIRDTLDCNPVFHGNVVSVNQMIGIMMGSIVVFGIIYYVVTLLSAGESGR